MKELIYQLPKEGTKIYDVGTVLYPEVGEFELTYKTDINRFGQLCIVLKSITKEFEMLVSIEWLIKGLQQHTAWFLTREEAEEEVLKMLKRNKERGWLECYCE